MTNIRQKLLSLATIIAFSAFNGFAYNVVKSEFRSAWVATVWALDWPTTGASAETQMAELDRMLDSLANNNFNAVNFQTVRSERTCRADTVVEVERTGVHSPIVLHIAAYALKRGGNGGGVGRGESVGHTLEVGICGKLHSQF